MTLYFQKARELGELILASGQARALAEANRAGAGVEQARHDYQALVNQVLNMVKAAVYEDMEADGGCEGCCKKPV